MDSGNYFCDVALETVFPRIPDAGVTSVNAGSGGLDSEDSFQTAKIQTTAAPTASFTGRLNYIDGPIRVRNPTAQRIAGNGPRPDARTGCPAEPHSASLAQPCWTERTGSPAEHADPR